MEKDLLRHKQNLYIVDFDIPREPKSKRMAFYRQLTKIKKKMGLFGKTSTMSVLISVDRHLAEEVYYLASKYGRANIYVGRKLDV